MNHIRLSKADNFHLYDFNILGELGYLILDETLLNAYPKQSQHGICFPENTMSSKSHNIQNRTIKSYQSLQFQNKQKFIQESHKYLIKDFFN